MHVRQVNFYSICPGLNVAKFLSILLIKEKDADLEEQMFIKNIKYFLFPQEEREGVWGKNAAIACQN